MRVELRPMTEPVFASYLDEHQQQYARDRMLTDRESWDQALQTTLAQHADLLPDGLQTPGHYFYTVRAEGSEQELGYVWIACRPPGRELSLYHIFIVPEERRKGYGSLTLKAIETKAQELGCSVIWLNVMGHNQGAIDFYLAQGYSVGALHMNKIF